MNMETQNCKSNDPPPFRTGDLVLGCYHIGHNVKIHFHFFFQSRQIKYIVMMSKECYIKIVHFQLLDMDTCEDLTILVTK